MIKPYVITPTQVKQYLNITDATYDLQIDIWIPVVSDFLVNANNGYLNSEYLETGTADTTDTDATLTSVLSIEYDNLQSGNVVKIAGVADNVTITDYDEDNTTIELSSAATATAEGSTLYIRVLPAGAKAVVAKMIWYMIDTNNITKETGIKTERIEDYSVTYTDRISQLGAGDYPQAYLDGLSNYRRPKFI